MTIGGYSVYLRGEPPLRLSKEAFWVVLLIPNILLFGGAF